MTGQRPPFYITTPIYYVNDSPHIGHAYTTIACDVMARFMALDGRDVFFLTGTDEHGQKVAKAAEAAGKTPQALCDEVSMRFRNLVNTGDNLLNISNNDFIRTTEERHKKACQELWRRIEKNGYIYKANYGGWYAVRDEAYYAESELIEKDGKKCAPTGAPVEWVEEESYFFKLSAFEEKLLALYDTQEDFVLPSSRLNEVRSFVKGGLKDLSISRTTFNWGVEVPEGAEVRKERGQQAESALSVGEANSPCEKQNVSQRGNQKDHIMYVWIDALTNYLTATGWPDESGKYLSHWERSASDSETGEGLVASSPHPNPLPEGEGIKYGNAVHVVGKDILRFHAVYWPAFLMAADLPVPKRIVAHGWWTIEGEKMSKSIGNVLSPQEMIEAAGGVDQLRYFMLKAMPFGNDGDFSKERMIETINADLANNIGNLAQRTLSMIQKNCGGVVPDTIQINEVSRIALNGFYGIEENDFIDTRAYKGAMSHFDYQSALHILIAMSGVANEYIDKQAPWKLKKEGKEAEMQTVLYVLAESIRCIAILLQPFCPTAASKLLDQLAVPANERTFAHLTAEFALKPGTPLPAPEGVFPRLQPQEKKV